MGTTADQLRVIGTLPLRMSGCPGVLRERFETPFSRQTIPDNDVIRKTKEYQS